MTIKVGDIVKFKLHSGHMQDLIRVDKIITNYGGYKYYEGVVIKSVEYNLGARIKFEHKHVEQLEIISGNNLPKNRPGVRYGRQSKNY